MPNSKPHQIKLCSLYDEFRRQGTTGKSDYRRGVLNRLEGQEGITQSDLARADYNVDRLWDLFNNEDSEICGYFEIPTGMGAEDVQEIFVRLNTGGVVPTQADLVFSMIHVKHYDFQEQIRHVLGEIHNASQIDIGEDEVLQILFYVIYQSTRVDLDRVRRTRDTDIDKFQQILGDAIEPLKAFYKRFLFDEFHVNTTSVYRSQIALLPLLLYFYRHKVRDLTRIPLAKMKKFFVLSQLNDWSLQALLTSFATLIQNSDDFPLDEMMQRVESDGRRRTDVTEQALLSLPKLTLKVLLPRLLYTLIPNRGRLNPEDEHIFPRNPREKDLPVTYREHALSLWNLQLGVPGDINSQKRNMMPREFFRGREDVLATHYNFLPTCDLDDPMWDYHNIAKFCSARKARMLEDMRQLYGISVADQ